MKYLIKFFKWLLSLWLLDKSENTIEEIPQSGIKKRLKELPPEVLKREIINSPKKFGEYFLNHKMPKHLKKKK